MFQRKRCLRGAACWCTAWRACPAPWPWRWRTSCSGTGCPCATPSSWSAAARRTSRPTSTSCGSCTRSSATSACTSTAPAWVRSALRRDPAPRSPCDGAGPRLRRLCARRCCTRRRAAGARAGRGAPCPTACRPTPASSSTAGARPGTPRNDSSSVRSLRPRPLRLSAAAALAAPANPIRPRRVIRCSPGTAPGVRSRVVSRKITVTVGCRDVYFVRIC